MTLSARVRVFDTQINKVKGKVSECNQMNAIDDNGNVIPNTEFKLLISNPVHFGNFEQGKEYIVTFTLI